MEGSFSGSSRETCEICREIRSLSKPCSSVAAAACGRQFCVHTQNETAHTHTNTGRKQQKSNNTTNVSALLAPSLSLSLSLSLPLSLSVLCCCFYRGCRDCRGCRGCCGCGRCRDCYRVEGKEGILGSGGLPKSHAELQKCQIDSIVRLWRKMARICLLFFLFIALELKPVSKGCASSLRNLLLAR